MKRVVAGAHLPTWIFQPAKRPDDRAHYYLGTRRQSRLLSGYQKIERTTVWAPDDRADYCLDCTFLPQYTLEWSDARPMSEQWCGLGPMSTTSELGHLEMPMDFLA